MHSVAPSHLGMSVHAPSRRCCRNMLGFLQSVHVTLSSQDPHQSLPHQPWGTHLCSDSIPHLLSIAALGNHFHCEKTVFVGTLWFYFPATRFFCMIYNGLAYNIRYARHFHGSSLTLTETLRGNHLYAISKTQSNNSAMGSLSNACVNGTSKTSSF